MIYLDTNILVSLHLIDTLSDSAVAWLATQTAQLAISEWTSAEFHAVIGLRKRKNELTAAHAKATIEQFNFNVQTHMQMLNVTNDCHVMTSEWLRNINCTIQTGDALHLAIAHLGGATTLATFDERFAKAAQKLKLRNLAIELIPAKPSRPVPTHRVEQERATYQGKANKKNVGKN
jgi:predicted nucleic acid-binding protein